MVGTRKYSEWSNTWNEFPIIIEFQSSCRQYSERAPIDLSYSLNLIKLDNLNYQKASTFSFVPFPASWTTIRYILSMATHTQKEDEILATTLAPSSSSEISLMTSIYIIHYILSSRLSLFIFNDQKIGGAFLYLGGSILSSSRNEAYLCLDSS